MLAQPVVGLSGDGVAHTLSLGSLEMKIKECDVMTWLLKMQTPKKEYWQKFEKD